MNDLESIFGRSNTLRVLDFLVKGRKDYTLTQIRGGTNLSRTAIRNSIIILKEVDVVIETGREDSKSLYYEFNIEGKNFYNILQIYKLMGINFA